MTKTKSKLVTLEEIKLLLEEKFSQSEKKAEKRFADLEQKIDSGFTQVEENFDELHTAIQTFVGDAVIPLDKRVTKLEHKIFPAQI